MSLKAKIEAVIYAAEEPVTLAQLAAIFPEEAAEHRETRLRAEAEARTAAEAAAAEPATDAAPDAISGAIADLTANPAEGASEAPAEPEAAEPAAVEPESAEAEEPVGDESGAEPTAEPDAEAGADEPAAEVAADALADEAVTEGPSEAEEPVSEEAESSSEEPAPAEPASAALTPEDERRLARQRERELREEIRLILNELMAEYANDARGMEIREIAGGYRVSTKAEYHDAVRSFVKSLKPPLKLSLQALETLAVIAYKQPVTAPEVAEIRGVDSGGVLGSLVTRKLITTAGRKQVIGRPILYKTTKEFLLRFGLKDLNELPSLEEFEKMAGELADAEEPAAKNAPLPFEGEDAALLDEAAEADEKAEADAELLSRVEEEPHAEPEVEVVEVEAVAEAEPVAEAEIEAEVEAGPEAEPEPSESQPRSGGGPSQEGTIPMHGAKAIVVTEYEEAEADLPSVEAHVEITAVEPAPGAEEEDAGAGDAAVEAEKEEA